LNEETNEWVLNGEKIFVTAGDKSFTEYEKLGKGFIVVWATIDPSAGRKGMRAFVVEGGTPGAKITKLEHKMGIRASDTASISLVDARVPFDHILGSPTVEKRRLVLCNGLRCDSASHHGLRLGVREPLWNS
jgi:acyl-CoA dehydrogenase